jgi:membrane-bound serine protease (ClpP class)
MRSVLAIFTLLWISSRVILAQTSGVILLTADCAIHPACADYISAGIKMAEKEGAACLIIKLNTPGGLLKSTRVIVSDILESRVPVAVFVAPSGSQAASAGVFITLAGHIAAMAPGTNIGAAHPVSLQGTQDSIMMEKATNDAAAFIRTISEKRHRNVEWAEDAVRKSLSITETEALNENVIDLVANDVRDLLELIDGREVETVEGRKVLHTKNAEIVEMDMSLSQKLLSILSDPNLAYILLMFGIYGLFFELYSPGAIFPGVIGGICLILAFYSMHALPVNYAGLALIIFAVILFILEIKIVSYGILSIGGIISLLLGSLMLIDEESMLEAVGISIEIIILIVVLSAAFFLFAIVFGIKAQKKRVATGTEGIIGERGVVLTNLKPVGEVRVHGEIWNAESIDGNIHKGSFIQVVGIENLKLIVKKLQSAGTPK